MTTRRATIEHTTLETATLRADAREVLASSEQLLDDLGALARAVREIVPASPDVDSADDLRLTALRLRCLASQGHALLSDLARQAGRLEGLALVQRASQLTGR
jgi:hypothetical protein